MATVRVVPNQECRGCFWASSFIGFTGSFKGFTGSFSGFIGSKNLALVSLVLSLVALVLALVVSLVSLVLHGPKAWGGGPGASAAWGAVLTEGWGGGPEAWGVCSVAHCFFSH